MTTPIDAPARGAHLVGSVPLASAEAVFQTVADRLGDVMTRTLAGALLLEQALPEAVGALRGVGCAGLPPGLVVAPVPARAALPAGARARGGGPRDRRCARRDAR